MKNTREEHRDSRKVAERKWQENSILTAALDIFAAHGYEGASMQEVAEISGFSVGHIYNVIGKKEHLFDEVLYRGGSALESDLLQRVHRLANRPAVERLDGLFDEILVFFDEHPKLFHLFLNEANGDLDILDPPFSRRVVEIKRRIHDCVRSLFEEAQQGQTVASLDPSEMTVAALQIIKGFLSLWAQDDYRTPAHGKTEIIRQIIWHGLSREPEQPSRTP